MEMGFSVATILGILLSVLIAVTTYRLDRKWRALDRQWQEDFGDLLKGVSESVAEFRQTSIEADSEPEAEPVEERVTSGRSSDYSEIDGSSVSAEASSGSVRTYPRDLAAYVDELRSRAIPLDYSNLSWSKKVRCGDEERRGNLGWFVSDGGDKRFFIHRGRGVLVREAIPQRYLTAWCEQTGLRPCEIELDFKSGSGSGNHSWHLRTYSGRAWRISAGGRAKTGLTVAEEEA